MGTLGLGAAQCGGVLRVLAFLLKLGNVQFEPQHNIDGSIGTRLQREHGQCPRRPQRPRFLLTKYNNSLDSRHWSAGYGIFNDHDQLLVAMAVGTTNNTNIFIKFVLALTTKSTSMILACVHSVMFTENCGSNLERCSFSAKYK